VDAEGKRLAAEILFSLALQYDSPSNLIKWVEKVIACFISYEGKGGVVRPSLSLEFCSTALEEIRKCTLYKQVVIVNGYAMYSCLTLVTCILTWYSHDPLPQNCRCSDLILSSEVTN